MPVPTVQAVPSLAEAPTASPRPQRDSLLIRLFRRLDDNLVEY